MHFKFVCNYYDQGTITSHEFSEESLPVIIENFEQFLRGCGFQIKNLEYDVPGP